MIKEQFDMLAAYHAAMNRQVYASCEALTEAQLKDDSGVFFKSVLGTLNHMLLTDRVWLATFQGKKYDYESLDQVLFADFTELKSEREQTDRDIAAWLTSVSSEQLQDSFHDRLTFPLWVAVTHFFNHQTHHRGQVSALLSQQGIDYGTTDLPWVPEAMAAIES